MARSLAATHGVDSGMKDTIDAIRAHTNGHGADVVIDAVGRPETYKQVFYARDLAGTVERLAGCMRVRRPARISR